MNKIKKLEILLEQIQYTIDQGTDWGDEFKFFICVNSPFIGTDKLVKKLAKFGKKYIKDFVHTYSFHYQTPEDYKKCPMTDREYNVAKYKHVEAYLKYLKLKESDLEWFHRSADEDQPETCPYCTSRTDWEDVGNLEHHTCIANGHQFIVKPEKE